MLLRPFLEKPVFHITRRFEMSFLVAEAVAVAVTEAVAEADQPIHDRSIHDPSI